MLYNEHKNKKVSVSSTANNVTRAVSAEGNSTKTLDDLIYLKNRIEEVQNKANNEGN